MNPYFASTVALFFLYCSQCELLAQYNLQLQELSGAVLPLARINSFMVYWTCYYGRVSRSDVVPFRCSRNKTQLWVNFGKRGSQTSYVNSVILISVDSASGHLI